MDMLQATAMVVMVVKGRMVPAAPTEEVMEETAAMEAMAQEAEQVGTVGMAEREEGRTRQATVQETEETEETPDRVEAQVATEVRGAMVATTRPDVQEMGGMGAMQAPPAAVPARVELLATELVRPEMGKQEPPAIPHRAPRTSHSTSSLALSADKRLSP